MLIREKSTFYVILRDGEIYYRYLHILSFLNTYLNLSLPAFDISFFLNSANNVPLFPDGIPAKPVSLSSVFCWGGGINTPIKLPLPSSETQVTQVSAGRTQKAAVTKTGRLFVWEVSYMCICYIILFIKHS